jgi:hypothetical protein
VLTSVDHDLAVDQHELDPFAVDNRILKRRAILEACVVKDNHISEGPAAQQTAGL